jgi:hypothetical protein
LEHRASNPVSIKNLNATETSATEQLLRPYVPARTKRTTTSSSISGGGGGGGGGGSSSSSKEHFPRPTQQSAQRSTPSEMSIRYVKRPCRDHVIRKPH